MWKSSLMTMLSVALKIKLHFCNCASPLHSCDTELLRDKAARQQRKFSARKCTVTGRGQKHCLDTVSTSMLTAPAGGWNPNGPTEISSQHQLVWNGNQTLFNVGHVQKKGYWNGMWLLAEENLYGLKILSFTKRWLREELSELHGDTSSLVKINSEW